MIRSPSSIAIGAILVGSSFIVPLALLRIAPSAFYGCATVDGSLQCSGNFGPIIWSFLPAWVAGVGLSFFGVFGRKFIEGPFFIVGMLPLTWGSLGVVSGYLSLVGCSSAPFILSCIAVNPGIFYPAILAGLIVISVQVLLSFRTIFATKHALMTKVNN